MDAAHDVRRPLGEVLLQQGLITADQLEQALAVQQETERQLGEVLVTLGFISPGVVANGLAEQSGGPLKTEYGISAGFGGVPEPTVAPEPAPDVLAAWRTAVEQRDAMIERFRDELRLRTEHAAAVSGQLDAATNRIEELEAQLAERGSESDPRAELEALLASAVSEREELRARVAELRSTSEELERRLAEPPPPTESARTYDETSHLLYVPSKDGYRLLEQAGPAPQPGEPVEVEGLVAQLVVARVGPSPLPGSALACAYLTEA